MKTLMNTPNNVKAPVSRKYCCITADSFLLPRVASFCYSCPLRFLFSACFPAFPLLLRLERACVNSLIPRGFEENEAVGVCLSRSISQGRAIQKSASIAAVFERGTDLEVVIEHAARVLRHLHRIHEGSSHG